MANSSLYGLLLVGGKSRRMGQDKAQLIYRDNQPEWQRLHQLLKEVCDEVFLCHREDQDFGAPAIVDPAQGPLAAIDSAQKQHSKVQWLVIACDLPLLNADTLHHLVEHIEATADVTSYRSRVDHQPEPLCAIYAPSSHSAIQNAIDANVYCPREVLSSLKVQLIDLKDAHALDNANSPADTLEIQSHLNHTRSMKSLSVRYFAQLREIAAKEAEDIQTESVTPSGLYEELKARYHFSHKQKHLMVAINDDFVDWSTPLQEGDEVVFIPPVAGG